MAVEQFLLGREQFGMRFGLERMRRLLGALGDPQNAVPAVHVVGTNGKSSTTLMTAAALRAQGVKTGAFTSPHLLSFRERIELDGFQIATADFAEVGTAVATQIEIDDAHAAEDDRVTQFEAVTAIALVAFDRAGCEALVIEAGLGGRLDATNVLGDSRVQVITGVGIDHTKYLGDTIEEIAREKAAVIRSGAAVVSGPLGQAARVVVNQIADERDANWIELHRADPVFDGLAGEFVRANATLALAVSETALARIRPGEWFARDAAIEAIERFSMVGALAGRLQLTNTEPLEVRDAAHNPQAAAALTEAIGELAGERPVTLLVAMLQDKPIDDTLRELLRAVPEDGVVVCTAARNPRSLAAAELAGRVSALAPGARVEAIDDPLAALAAAREAAGDDGLLSITGSNYLLADLMRDPAEGPGATL